jgi:hypothetical protein
LGVILFLLSTSDAKIVKKVLSNQNQANANYLFTIRKRSMFVPSLAGIQRIG